MAAPNFAAVAATMRDLEMIPSGRPTQPRFGTPVVDSSEHTPGPWVSVAGIDGGLIYAPTSAWAIIQCRSFSESRKQRFLSLQEAQANAAYVVKAVNAHAKLVSAAEAAKRALARVGSGSATDDRNQVATALAWIDAALQSVEG